MGDRRGRRWGATEHGQASVEYVGLIVVVALMVAALSPVGASAGRAIAAKIVCVARSLGQIAAPGCPPAGDAPPASPVTPAHSPTPAPDWAPTPEPTPAPTAPTCPTDVQTGPMSTTPGVPWRLIGLGCRYVPVPPSCGSTLAVAGYVPERPPPAATQLQPVRTCVGSTTGPPQDDQNDPSCRDAQPDATAPGDPTRVQVGCRSYVVPNVCTGRWDCFRAADPASASAASLGLDLGQCVTTWYGRAETPCVVSQSLEVDRNEVVALFFIKVSDEKAMLVEHLGDGKVRVHLVTGSAIGGQLSTPDVTGPVFEVARLSGYDTDDTFEFADTKTAQTWVEWFKKREDRAAYGQGGYANYLQQSDPLTPEPLRRKHSTARTHVTTLTTKLTVDSTSAIPTIPGRAPRTRVVGGANGVVYEKSTTRQVETEDRLLTSPEGTRVQTYKVSDTQAATLLLKLGGTVAKVGAEFQKALQGDEVKGELSLTQVRAPDGSLDRVVITADDTLMHTLSEFKVDVSALLPYGFSLSAGWSRKDEAGTTSLAQVVLNAERLSPPDRARASALADAVFPRDPDGSLNGAPVDLGDGYQALAALVREQGSTRTAGYDVQRRTQTLTGGLSLVGLPVISATSISVTENQQLTDSQLQVVDVHGQPRSMSPTPACSLPAVDPRTYPYDDPNDPRTPPYDQGWWS